MNIDTQNLFQWSLFGWSRGDDHLVIGQGSSSSRYTYEREKVEMRKQDENAGDMRTLH
jgi:hypothetical protein